jgi:hypothetical protein
VASRGPCPPSRCRPRDNADRVEVVDIGRHWVIREAGLPTRVHCGVPLHELPPAQRFISAGLEGEVGEIVGGEPKTLMRWVWPQHADDDVVREASDESLTPRSPREDIGTRRPGADAPDDGLHWSGVDETEGAET